jgi:hypothetical protein
MSVRLIKASFHCYRRKLNVVTQEADCSGGQVRHASAWGILYQRVASAIYRLEVIDFLPLSPVVDTVHELEA